jgi:hypothetical protein
MLRGIKENSVLNGSYLVDGGAERLLLQWKVERRRQINQRDGNPDTTEVLDKDFQDLLDLAGTPGFQAKRPAQMELHEYLYLMKNLAPNESDGDDGIWNLFEEFLFTRKPGSLDDRHDLSKMMARWWIFQVSPSLFCLLKMNTNKNVRMSLSRMSLILATWRRR